MSVPSRPAVADDITAWFRRDTPLRRFLRTQTGSGTVLLAGVAAALIWANVDASSYARVWETTLSVHLGTHGVSMDLRGWVNSGLMTFFFLLVGLEARRELDIGEFRDRPRIVLPVLAALGGMAGAVSLYVLVNAGQPSVHGWGAAMTTDTALALGALALLGQRAPGRLRGFILTLTITDDIVGLIVIAVVYSHHVDPIALVLGAAFLAGAVVASRIFEVHSPLVYVALGVAAWAAVENSGVDPVVVGLAMGLVAYAAPAPRRELEAITATFRNFREQPTPVLSARVRQGLRRSLSPNDRLQQFWTPWSSYVIVPLFALANAGIAIDPPFLASAYSSKITLGIMAGYVVGKPVGVTLAAVVIAKLSRGRLRPPVGWLAVTGAGTVAGIGFTVSLLVASIAFSGDALREATVGVLSAAVVSAGLSQVVFRGGTRLPEPLRHALLLEGSDVIVDLVDPVDPDRDHIRGPADAPVTLVEYGDFECPYCGKAEPVVRELLADFDDLRYVWRHLPLTDVHPHAQLAAEAAEAAGAQGDFWAMHDLLLHHQGHLTLDDLVHYAEQLKLDTDRFLAELDAGTWSERIAADVESADLSGAAGTPSFFINGQRQPGPFDLAHLRTAVRTA
jgi:Na+/H+ antiporter NhaA